MNPPGDTELWRRACGGDADAFAQLFERHARAVYNYCYRGTGDWTTAEDLTSVVFLEAWRRRDRLEPWHDSALPLLYGVATNVVRQQRRFVRRHRAALRRLPVAAPTTDATDDVAHRLDDQRRVETVLADIRRLPGPPARRGRPVRDRRPPVRGGGLGSGRARRHGALAAGAGQRATPPGDADVADRRIRRRARSRWWISIVTCPPSATSRRRP